MVPLYLYNNFGECGLILLIISLLHSEIEYLVSSLQMYCCIILQNLSIQLYNFTAVIYFKPPPGPRLELLYTVNKKCKGCRFVLRIVTLTRL